MEQENFLKMLNEIVLDTDSDVGMDTMLKDVDEWDSLAHLTFDAMANKSGKNIDRKEVRMADSVAALYKLWCEA